MENKEKKEYEIGYVEITTQEYKDLITEAVENRKDAEKYLHDKWKVERENELFKNENALMQKRIVELEARLADMEFTMKEVAING